MSRSVPAYSRAIVKKMSLVYSASSIHAVMTKPRNFFCIHTKSHIGFESCIFMHVMPGICTNGHMILNLCLTHFLRNEFYFYIFALPGYLRPTY